MVLQLLSPGGGGVALRGLPVPTSAVSCYMAVALATYSHDAEHVYGVVNFVSLTDSMRRSTSWAGCMGWLSEQPQRKHIQAYPLKGFLLPTHPPPPFTLPHSLVASSMPILSSSACQRDLFKRVHVQAVYTALKETESRATDLLPLWKIPPLAPLIPRQRKALEAVKLIRQTTEELIAKCKEMVDAEEQVCCWGCCMVQNVAVSVLQYIRQTADALIAKIQEILDAEEQLIKPMHGSKCCSEDCAAH